MDPARTAAANPQSATFTVLRLLFDARRPNAVWETAATVGVVADAPTSPESLSAALAALSGRSSAEFSKTAELKAVSIGPVLDSPDKVQVSQFSRVDRRFILEIDYTRMRMSGVTMPSSLAWRAMVVAPVPAGLSAGHYEIEAVWRAVSAISGGSRLPVADLRQAFRFDIIE